MRLIDADMLYNDIVRNCDNLGEAETFKAHYLDDQPTIEAEPVKHGKWIETHIIYNNYGFTCSNCEELCNEYHAIDNGEYDYCPYCGAKMDLEG